MLTLGDGVRARKEKARRRLLKCEIMFQLYTLRAHINREFIRTDARRRVLGSREESGLFGSEAAAELSQGVKEVLLCTYKKHWFAMAKRHADLRLSLALQTRNHIIQYRNIRIGNYGYVLLLLSYLYGVKEVN